MVDGEKHVGLDELSFDYGSADCENRLVGEDNGSFGNAPNVACELEILKIREEFLVELVFASEIFDIAFCKMEIGDVFSDLLETCGNSITAAVGYTSVEYVKISDLVTDSGMEISAAHSKLIKIAEQSKIIFVSNHSNSPFLPFYP
jgi:hypothetical protein